MKQKIFNFKVVIEQDEDGVFVAHVPAVPGCISDGETYEEACVNIKEALELCLDVAKDDKDYADRIDFPDSKSLKPRFFGTIDMPVNFSMPS